MRQPWLTSSTVLESATVVESFQLDTERELANNAD
jgi:hypothetical protein